MYSLKYIHGSDTEPWNIPLPARIKQLRGYLAQDAKICLIIYHNADTSTFRYRAYNLYQYTAGASQWRVIYCYRNELGAFEPYLYKVNILSFSRQQWSRQYDAIIKKAKQQGVKVIFDTDDLVFDLDYVPLLLNTLGTAVHDDVYNYWFSYIGRIGSVARMADAFTATNDFIGSKLEGKFGKPYEIIPNFINKEQLDVSKIYSGQKKAGNRQKPFIIGYFSGSPSHVNDFNAIAAELCALLRDYPGIYLKIVGFMEFFTPAVVDLLNAGRITFTPLVDFLTLQYLMAEVDVSIAPLVINDFTNCKTELKFFEAAIVDTITIASKSYTFEMAIKDGETGFLCSPGQWYGTIEKLYKKETDEQAIVSKAKQYVLETYTGERIVSQINAAYDSIAGQ